MDKLFAKSGDPDQMPHSAASDLGLHCLPITLLRVSRLQWVNYCTVQLGFSKLLGKLVLKYVSTYTKGTLKQRSVKIGIPSIQRVQLK